MVTSLNPMWRVQLVGTGVAGSPYYITGYFDVTGGTAAGAAADWFAFNNPGASSIRAGLSISLGSEVDQVEPATGNVISVEPVSPSTVLGTNSADPLPPFTQLLRRFRTGTFVNGREIRGRSYFPGLTEPESTGGRPLAALITAEQGRINTLLGSTNSQLVVYSRKNGVQAPVISGTPWTEWSVLRSRRD